MGYIRRSLGRSLGLGDCPCFGLLSPFAMYYKSEHMCLLMDVRMPIMDGLEATAHIRRNPVFASLRIVGVTANANSLTPFVPIVLVQST